MIDDIAEKIAEKVGLAASLICVVGFLVAILRDPRFFAIISCGVAAPALVVQVAQRHLVGSAILYTVFAGLLLTAPIMLSSARPEPRAVGCATVVLFYLSWPHRGYDGETYEGEALAAVAATALSCVLCLPYFG